MTLSRGKSWPAIDCVHTIIFDFDGVFTNNKVYVSQGGEEWVCCDRADGLALDMLRRYCRCAALDIEYFILSTERNPVVSLRAKKLKVECTQSISDKLTFVTDYLQHRRADDPDPFKGLLYLGNDLNDLPVMERAGFSVAPHDAHERVKRVASVVMTVNGGEGFVRATIERLLGISNMAQEEIHGLICNR